MNMAGSTGGIAVPILVGVILQMAGGFAPVLGFFAACSAVFVFATLFISLDEVRHD
ncbi:hypothetical protein D3C84_1064500 [compost metagenome]